MSQSTAAPAVHHATFTIERRLSASPERVFRAFSDVNAKARWFGGNRTEWTRGLREMDFRVGGTERLVGTWKDAGTTDFRATYHDIVPNERIVYVYDMYHRDVKLSVSLATIEVERDGDGTRLRVTEQGAYFDGAEGAASREQGTSFLMDAMERSLDD